MKHLGVESIPERGRVLNAVALQNAVLCAECDVVSDSPNDRCLVCGSRSLFNIARMFGGNLPKGSGKSARFGSAGDDPAGDRAEFSRASQAAHESARLNRCVAT